jgi:hypothetical protein
MLKRTFIRFAFLLLVFRPGFILAGEITSLLPSLEKLPGWKFSQAPEVYKGDDLFELIDGGADIYFEYGFSQVVSADYTDPGQNITQAEIYEMSDAPAAYGIFSLMQQSSAWTAEYGQQTVITPDYIAFWKDKYYVIVSWSSRNDPKSGSMDVLAGIITQNIAGTGNYPDLVKILNTSDPGLRFVYLHGNLALSNFYYFDYKDIFEISDGAACTPGNHHQIVFRYLDPPKALAVLASAKQAMISNKRFTDISMIYQGYTCNDNKGNQVLVRQDDRYILVLVALEPGTSLTLLMDEVVQKLESQQN